MSWPRWFTRCRPVDLIADANARCEAIRAEEINQRCDLDDYVSESQGNLSAAGGWCAPSELNYGFLTLPEIQVKRGGVKWPTT